jgi:hypothetical protein
MYVYIQCTFYTVFNMTFKYILCAFPCNSVAETKPCGTTAPPQPPSIVTNAGRFQWITVGNMGKWLYSRGTHGGLARNVGVLESLLSPTLTREIMDRVYDVHGAVVPGASRRAIFPTKGAYVPCLYLKTAT